MDRGGWVYVDLFRFVTHVFRVALTLVQFVLALFPDKEKSSVFMAGEVCVCVCGMFVCCETYRGAVLCAQMCVLLFGMSEGRVCSVL